VAGLTLAVSSPTATPFLVPPASLRPFLARRGGDIVLEYTEESPPTPRGEPLFESGGVWTLHRHDRGLLYSFRTPVLDPPLYKAVEIDRGLRRGRLYFPPPRHGRRPPWALAYPLDQLLFQHRFASFEEAAEVHAFGVVHEGRVLLFCGHSGAGKSTLARLWRRKRPRDLVLSDDRLILRRAGDRLRAHGTPWHGAGGHASPLARPLGAVFFLRQDGENRALPLGTADAAAELFARTFPPLWDASAVGRVLALCAQTAAAVPAFELRFRRDGGAITAALGSARVDRPGARG